MTDESAPTEPDEPRGASVMHCAGIEVDPATRKLRINGGAVAIERRAYDLLVHLMRNAGRVVDKDELLREVWHSRPVSESTIAQAVSRVRRALGGGTDKWVATVYGVGYRFTGEVEIAEGTQDSASPTPEPVEQTGRARWVAFFVLALALVVLLAASIRHERPPEDELRIAVLPVENETGDAQLDWVQLGVLPLIDRALQEGGVQRVQTGQVLSTLRRYPEADDTEAQARVLRLNTRADRVLVPRLSLADGGYRLEMRSADGSVDRYDLDLQGADVAVLAVAAGKTLSESLSRWQGAERAQRALVTEDPFINQAFARGLDARLRGQWEEAARFFDTVLAAAPDLLDAKYHLALATRQLGDWDYTEQLHEELLQAAMAAGDVGMIATVQSVSGILAWRRGKRDEAETWYRKALANYREEGNADYIANTMGNLGILAATRGEYALAEQRLREAVDHYGTVGDRYNEATGLKNLGQLFVDQGRLEEAAEQLEQSLDIRRTLELPLQVALTQSSIADIDMARGNWQQALVKYRSVLDTAREYDSPTLKAQSNGDLSTVLRRLGQLDEARRAAADAHRIATELGSPSNQAFALLQHGRAEHDLGHWQRAVELFEQSRALYIEVEEPVGENLARIAQAESWIESGRLDDAEVLLETAARRIEETELERLESGLARARARLAERRGDLDAAVNAQREAYRLATERQNTIARLDYGGQLGLLLMARGEADEIAALAEDLKPRAEASASALQFLARRYRELDPDRALTWTERRRGLMGDGWSPADEREYQALRSQAVPR